MTPYVTEADAFLTHWAGYGHWSQYLAYAVCRDALSVPVDLVARMFGRPRA